MAVISELLHTISLLVHHVIEEKGVYIIIYIICNNYHMPMRAILELLHRARGQCAIISVLSKLACDN